MRTHTWLARFVLTLALIAPQAAAAQEPSASVGRGGSEVGAEYRIGPEDLIDIAVWNNPTISRTTPVRPDGKISLPLLNDIQAAGLTPSELRAGLTERLKEYMPNPEVSVIVREVNHFKVSVLGEVKKPGRYDFRSQATVLDALAVAGGLSDFASRSRIVILRNNGQGSAVQRIPVNYNKIVSADAGAGPLFLQPGDIVLVP